MDGIHAIEKAVEAMTPSEPAAPPTSGLASNVEVMAARPNLLDYIVFFETEPEWVNAEGWYYGARFSTERGDDRVVATIAPDETEFEFEWWQCGVCRIHLKSVSATKWEIETSSTREFLRVTYNDDHVKFCELQLKPHVRIDWAMTW